MMGLDQGPDQTIGPDRTGLTMLHDLLSSFFLYFFLLVLCGGQSWLTVFLLHLKYTISYHVILYRTAGIWNSSSGLMVIYLTVAM